MGEAKFLVTLVMQGTGHQSQVQRRSLPLGRSTAGFEGLLKGNFRYEIQVLLYTLCILGCTINKLEWFT